MSLGNKLYTSVLGVFLIFTAIMIFLQHGRERAYRQDALNANLQEYNFRLYCQIISGDSIPVAADSLFASVKKHDLRITVVGCGGDVIYDSCDSIPERMENHLQRKEVREAIAKGDGSDYDRLSATLNKKFFYSATYFPQSGIVIRTALPYDADLAQMLSGDTRYLWFILGIFVVLTLILWRFINRLAVNISKLRQFAGAIGKDGGRSNLEDSKFPNDELGNIASDIVTIYRKLQDTRHQQDILKRQLTQNIAHELKTPVASIHGYIETLLSNPDIDPATYRQFMERCYAQTNRLSSLLHDISTLNKLDNAQMTHEMESVNITQMVASIQKETALQLSDKDMAFVNNLPVNVIVEGDRSLIYSIFRNLTDNAIAYAGESTAIELSAHETRQSWYFSFSDNGIGVAESHLPRLFERFYRVDKGRSRANGGTGLGLAIVKNAVSVHGGSIKVANRKGGGLIFIFSLRKKPQPQQATEQQ